MYRGRSVAVTGARGYIGAALAGALSREGATLRLYSRTPAGEDAGIRQVDIETLESWKEIVQADVIFHLAGNTSVHVADHDPGASLRSTVLPVCHLVTAAAMARRVPRVVYASTATVYGLTSELPVSEERPPAPLTTYDRHKWYAERILEQGSADGSIDAAWLRLANVYGPSPARSAVGERGVLNRAAALAVEGADLPVYDGGSYIRDYVYIDDVIRAFLAAGASPLRDHRCFNVASGIGTPVRKAFRQVISAAGTASGRQARMHDESHEVHPIERRHFVGSITRMTAEFGWRPSVTLLEGITHLVEDIHAARTVTR